MKIQVKNGRTIEPALIVDGDGFSISSLGQAAEGPLKLVLQGDDLKNCRPFTVVGREKKISALRMNTPVDAECFVEKQVHISNEGRLFAAYPQNHLRYAKVDSQGQYEIWQVGLIVQNGQLLLVQQRTYAGKLYIGEDAEAVCPRFDAPWSLGKPWPEMADMLIGLLPDGAELESISSYQESSVEVVPEAKAIVEWYDLIMQFGLVRLPNGKAASVKAADCYPRQNGLRFLLAGEIVECSEILPTPAESQSTLPFNVRGVTVAA